MKASGLWRSARLAVGAVACATLVATVRAQDAGPLLERALTQFEGGQFTDAAATYDELARVAPARAPYLWQRGIALYYAKRYTDCRRQFESHRSVNPDDVENAAWHFMCVARGESPEKARAALLPVGPDPRAPMREIYEMFRGRLTPAQVLTAARSPDALFFAELYVGLYFDALGMTEPARQHLTIAAAPQYRAAGGYMHMVAVVHVRSMP